MKESEIKDLLYVMGIKGLPRVVNNSYEDQGLSDFTEDNSNSNRLEVIGKCK